MGKGDFPQMELRGSLKFGGLYFSGWVCLFHVLILNPLPVFQSQNPILWA